MKSAVIVVRGTLGVWLLSIMEVYFIIPPCSVYNERWCIENV